MLNSDVLSKFQLAVSRFLVAPRLAGMTRFRFRSWFIGIQFKQRLPTVSFPRAKDERVGNLIVIFAQKNQPLTCKKRATKFRNRLLVITLPLGI